MRLLRRVFVLLAPAVALPAVILASVVPSPARTENGQRGPAYVFVIDATNSMTGKIKGAVKLDMAKGALIRSFHAAPGNVAAGLLSFGDHPRRACEDVVVLIPLGSANRNAAQVRSAFARLTPTISGKTPILTAAAQGAQLIKAQGNGAMGGVIVVTDGGDDCTPRACETAQIFRDRHPGVAINIVSLRPERVTNAQLQCIAAATGGLFSEANTEQQIAQAVAAVFQRAPELGVHASDSAGSQILTVTPPAPSTTARRRRR